MKPRRYVIVNTRRFFTFITIILALLAIAVVTFVDMSGSYGKEESAKYEEHWVQSGDSLWNIALEYAPEGYDVRKLIFEIKEFNNLKTSMIFQGDKLFIPVYAMGD